MGPGYLQLSLICSFFGTDHRVLIFMDVSGISGLLVLFGRCTVLKVFLPLLYLIEYSRGSGLNSDGGDLFFDLFEVGTGGGGDDVGGLLVGRGGFEGTVDGELFGLSFILSGNVDFE